MLEDLERIARRVLGGPHPTTKKIENELQNARAALKSALQACQGSARAPTYVDEDQLSAELEAVLREAVRRADPQPSICASGAAVLVFAFAVAILPWVWRSPT